MQKEQTQKFYDETNENASSERSVKQKSPKKPKQNDIYCKLVLEHLLVTFKLSWIIWEVWEKWMRLREGMELLLMKSMSSLSLLFQVCFLNITETYFSTTPTLSIHPSIWVQCTYQGLILPPKILRSNFFPDKSENFEPSIFLDKSKKIGCNCLVQLAGQISESNIQ